MQLTTKQYAIMSVIGKGNGKDAAGNLIPADLNELLERIDYRTTKESMQFSIRALIKAKMLYKGHRETRRGRGRVTYYPTEFGLQMTRLGSLPSYIETSSSDPVLATLTGQVPRTEKTLVPENAAVPTPRV